jgi:pyruvate/2-oxoglutarate dehydrogenase complex dihydrolipoamide acyltransferase (E2) component
LISLRYLIPGIPLTMKSHKIIEFPRTRLATFDIGAIGKEKHYVTALLELNVGEARKKIKEKRKESGARMSFTGWLLKIIAQTVQEHKEVAAFRRGRRKLMIFADVDISIIVEREVNGTKVPLPLLIRKANEKTAEEITAEIESAKTGKITGEQMVLERGMSVAERIYYFLPGAIRRLAWRLMLKHPHFVFRKMGNVVVTAVGMMGQVNGWFVQTSVHPLSFGIGSITKKPVASGEEIAIGEILHMTILIDHNAVDGAPMARFIADLSERIESGNNTP